jgi:hypothetical protein
MFFPTLLPIFFITSFISAPRVLNKVSWVTFTLRLDFHGKKRIDYLN